MTSSGDPKAMAVLIENWYDEWPLSNVQKSNGDLTTHLVSNDE
jgi:hypothetical protein